MKRTSPLLLTLLLAACNFPALIDSPTSAMPFETSVALTVAAELNEPMESDATQPAPVETPGMLTAEYPTVTLEGGTGYIFASGETTTEDRDVWWNAQGFVPNTQMMSLGIVGSLTDVTALATSLMKAGEFDPAQGEAFAVEIDRDRDGAVEAYALIRVLGIEDRAITFEVLYPYAGNVIP